MLRLSCHLLLGAVAALQSPSPCAVPHRALASIPLTPLVDGDHSTAERLCAGLRRDSVVLVELSSGDARILDRMWACASYYFARSDAEHEAIALHESPFSPLHGGDQRLAGFKLAGLNVSCLDTRLRRADDGQLEMMPQGLDAVDRDWHEALLEAQALLSAIGLAVLTCVRSRVPAARAYDLGMMADGEAASLEHGVTSATVHRLLRYGGGSPAAFGADGASILFDSHTDATWFTLIPCSAVPGIEVLTPDGWCRPEAATTREKHTEVVAVLTGDFLDTLSMREYPAALHRVVRPEGTRDDRFSAPLLMRAAPRYRAARGCEGAQFDCM